MRVSVSRRKSGQRVAIALSVVTVFASFGVNTMRATPNCPDTPVASTTSSDVPVDVCIPDGFPLDKNPIKYFDDFSWKSFIAMIWPAADGERGVPDKGKPVDGSGPRVFETFKNDWELFKENPTPWSTFDSQSPCRGVSVAPGDLVLASFTKFGNLGQAGFGKLIHTLTAQNRTWVRYSTGFNRLEYDTIVTNKWFMRDVLDHARATFDDGALDVKAAWIEMAGIQNPERYYTRMAWIQSPVTGQCTQALVGLVGLHIVQKTPSRPQWIWSTFEQIDTVPPDA